MDCDTVEDVSQVLSSFIYLVLTNNAGDLGLDTGKLNIKIKIRCDKKWECSIDMGNLGIVFLYTLDMGLGLTHENFA